MARENRAGSRFLICGSLALAFVLVGGCNGARQPAEPPKPEATTTDPDAAVAGRDDRPDYKHIDLEYVGGEDCVKAHPETANLIKTKNPKKLRFWVRDAGDYYWKIAYDGSKTGASGDYFGAVPDIKCNDNYVKTGKHENVPAEGTFDWPYKVTVYQCVDGEQGPEVCQSDPRVRIRD